MLATVAVVATVNADTWATELGVLSKNKPIFILTGKPVTTGTSGAISLGGTIAGFVGAFFIGALAIIFVTTSNAVIAGSTSNSAAPRTQPSLPASSQK